MPRHHAAQDEPMAHLRWGHAIQAWRRVPRALVLPASGPLCCCLPFHRALAASSSAHRRRCRLLLRLLNAQLLAARQKPPTLGLASGADALACKNAGILISLLFIVNDNIIITSSIPRAPKHKTDPKTRAHNGMAARVRRALHSSSLAWGLRAQ